MKAKGSQQNIFVRIISSPYRALCKARDFYVRSMLDCANSNAVGLHGASQGPSLPRSFSAVSSRSIEDNDDYRELVRAASARSIGGSSDLEAYIKLERRARAGPRALPQRSISVAMGRIDEERPISYFVEDSSSKSGNVNDVVGKKKNHELRYPRSKSHAVARTSF